MNLLKLPRSFTLVGITPLVLVVCFTGHLSPVGAQPARPVNKTPNSGGVRLTPLLLSQMAKQKPFDFSGDGRPGRRAGGGSRSPCPSVDPPLTALIPATNWGKTVVERPTFWAYVPYSPQAVPVGEFSLQDEKGRDVYRTPLTLPKTPGLVSFSIPPTAAPLEINQWYRWYFKLYCQPQKLSTPVFVQGWVQRVELAPALESQLKATTPQEYTAYATNLIWYDALSRLAEMRFTNPSDAALKQDWAKLLSSRGIGLEHLNQQPLAGNATPYQSLGAD